MVITDTHGPKLSGLELLKAMKKSHPKIPVAVISTDNSDSTRGIVTKDRADFYLAKPIKMSDIKDVLSLAREFQDR